MIRFLEPYKDRQYNQIAGNWEGDYLEAKFDEGCFIHDEETGSIGLYANFTECDPIPTRKYKPEDFDLKFPFIAMVILHYKDYEVNNKNSDGKWTTTKHTPTWLESVICDFLIRAEMFNTPLKGSLILNNQSFTVKQIQKEFNKNPEAFIWDFLGLESLEKLSILDGLPRMYAPKNQANKGSSYSDNKVNLTQLFEERTDFAMHLLKRIFDVPDLELEGLIPFMHKLSPTEVEIAFKLLSIVTR
jgi:hypothetical protein